MRVSTNKSTTVVNMYSSERRYFDINGSQRASVRGDPSPLRGYALSNEVVSYGVM